MESKQVSMFDSAPNKRVRMKGEVLEITPKTASEFILPRHYSGRIPSISKAFGWYVSNQLQAVCTFGKPASHSLCIGVCGPEYEQNVFELNRLVRNDDFKEPLSQFVSACLRRLRVQHWIIVSYSDTAMNHHGYIYQACNFIYTGCTPPRTDIYTGKGKHSRHYAEEDKESEFRKYRSAKHRYVYFCTYNKTEKKKWKEALRYPVLPYPKGDNNDDYPPGFVIQDKVIEKKGECT